MWRRPNGARARIGPAGSRVCWRSDIRRPSGGSWSWDNLNTHGIESLYATYEPRHARQLAERLEIHYTPKHGSWLNIAEIELSTLCGQCLDRRIPSLAKMQREIEAWVGDRNQRQTEINWQFKTEDARIKLKSLYPQL